MSAPATTLVLSVVLTGIITACSGDFGPSYKELSGPSMDMAATPPTTTAPFEKREMTLAQGQQGQQGQQGGQTTTPPAQSAIDNIAAGSMLIRNGAASILVDSLEEAIAKVQQLATQLNGMVGNVSIASGENEVRSATLQVRVPAAQFDAAISGLKPIGKVEHSSTSAEDVGEEFVDVSARVANSKRLEERLISVLATRTGKLDEILAVERELARVREEIERYEGRVRYLRSRVAISTLTITVHEKAPLVSGVPGTNVIAEAFATMWRNFVQFVAAFIASLGVLVPLALIVGGFVYVLKRFIMPREGQPLTAPKAQAESTSP